jgi:sortase A
LLAWTVVVWRWQDPFTALYTHVEQRHLSAKLDREFAAYSAPRARPGRTVAAELRALATAASRFRSRVHTGQPIGRIVVPRMALDMVLVNGTDHDTLKKGPGRDPRTYMPGQRQLVYIAGHRTTYLAPFSHISHIDRLRQGDHITLQMPYATFVYRVTGHRVVPAADLSVLRSHGRETLELQACHPRFFAIHRYIAFAVPVRLIPRNGTPFSPPGRRPPALAGA